MSSKCAPFSIRNRIECTPMSSLLRWPSCWIERWRRNSSRYNGTSPLKKHGNRCEPCALSTSTLAMAREKDLSPRVALAPPESCDFSASTIATRTPERRTTRRHSDTFRNAIHSFQSFSGHTRKHGLASACAPRSTTPSAPSKEASRLLLDVASPFLCQEGSGAQPIHSLLQKPCVKAIPT